METKTDLQKAKIAVSSWGFNHCEGVSSEGLSGGLLILWNDEVQVEVIYMNKNLIFLYVVWGKRKFWLNCIHGHPNLQQRQQVWDQLIQCKQNIRDEEPWIVLGDFNQVVKGSDKVSLTNSQLQGAENLKQCLDVCCLSELSYKGQQFTWSSKRDQDRVTWERLDTAYANPCWFQSFDEATLTNLPVTVSNHGPMVLNIEKMPPFSKRPYRFEAMWTTHPQCKMVGNLTVRRRKLEDELAVVQQAVQNEAVRSKELALREELENVLEQEHLLWMQKSRSNWIVKGERNTKYFHTITKKRRARNIIISIKTSDVNTIQEPAEIERTFLHHFKDVYSNQHEESENNIRTLLQGINLPLLSTNHLEILNAPFEEKEVKEALFNLNPLKAVGYDGKPALFFQKFWEIVGKDTTEASLAFLTSRHLLKELNKTMITLIPKKKNPDKDPSPHGILSRIKRTVASVTAAFGTERREYQLNSSHRRSQVPTGGEFVQSKMLQEVPEFHQKSWMILISISRVQRKDWFGTGMIARNYNGETRVMMRSIKGETQLKVRVMLARSVLQRMVEAGAEELWIRKKDKKWKNALTGRTQVGWKLYPIVADIRTILTNLKEVNFFNQWPPLEAETRKLARTAATNFVSFLGLKS
ncbi:Endonuclease/exonuclease/phosphatase [Corchorus olitorius]|uniref:Endonuclease/exonuclease/phosphatase n=1 Tax=Corchorus olitorius TaxID=93759 RepID=A0A1R3HUV6_9ROSI|nr:Endonuclease/exonuclease/phosphatase [Corchorus olitorius]